MTVWLVCAAADCAAELLAGLLALAVPLAF